MKSYILFTFLNLFFIYNTFSQNIDKAFILKSKGENEKALEVFNKCIEKNKDILLAKYGIALIYSDKNFEKFNTVKAFYNLNAVNQKFTKIDAPTKIIYETKYNLSQNSINKLIEELAVYNLLNVKKTNKIEDYNNFLEVFGDSKIAEKALFSRDSIAYDEASKINTFNSFKTFYEKYPTSFFADSAKFIYEKFWQKMCYESFIECELANITNFIKKYPDYPFYNDSLKQIKEAAEYASKLTFQLGYIENNKTYYEEFIKKYAPLEPTFVALLTLINPLIASKNWNLAIETINNYKSYFKEDKRLEEIIKILNAKSLTINSKSIGNLVNSDAFEYAPVMSADGEFLYFCGQNRIDNLGEEDIFVSANKNGTWDSPTPLSSLNSKYSNEAPLSISADGTKLLLFADGDILYSEKTKDGWSKSKNFPSINSKTDWEADAMITSDGETVIFVSDRSNGIGYYHEQGEIFHGNMSGNTDIYIAKKTETGWSEPINLGEIINTPFCDRSPFLHPDMKTLYFSSEGHSGLGKLDVFKSTRLYDTSWIYWSEPENLGKEINTGDDEYGYRITTDGKIAYFSMFSGTQSDIYYFDLPKELRPEEVATIKGVISDVNSNVLEAEIVWENLSTNEKIGSSNTNPTNGKYFITFQLGKKYGYYVNKTGFYPLSGNIDLIKTKTSIDIEKNFQLISIDDIIKNDISIPLTNLFFDNDKYILKQESYPELQRLAEFLKSNNIKIEISGHTDNVGKPDYNIELSQKRANAVKEYLIELGCNENYLYSIGYGDSKPIVSNSTDDGKAKNRRVEFKVKQ